ncbi:hypothetical protein DLM45_03695 [Hyphomicrobium methylovorum]|uniref:DUF3617 domain-containing protein n=1 Tax=Hyphomicrobium methylovorum TaxID=84 RepID=UPI0015E6E17F|nr:DUF3617 family protein [Hyphomicrobium methylovorum]MBA2125327.1 hypothetical protein [Hyphomicrobium methylovorum]
MRLPILLFVPLLILTSGAAPALSAEQAALPERKAGLWELKTTMDEGNGPRDQTMTLCVDQAMEHNTVQNSILEHKRSCAAYDIKAENGGTVVDADCTFNQRKVISTTSMSGDFKSGFEIKIDSTTSDPEKTNQSVVIKRTIAQTGKYLGEACGDLKPGEAKGSDGSKFMVQ